MGPVVFGQRISERVGRVPGRVAVRVREQVHVGRDRCIPRVSGHAFDLFVHPANPGQRGAIGVRVEGGVQRPIGERKGELTQGWSPSSSGSRFAQRAGVDVLSGEQPKRRSVPRERLEHRGGNLGSRGCRATNGGGDECFGRVSNLVQQGPHAFEVDVLCKRRADRDGPILAVGDVGPGTAPFLASWRNIELERAVRYEAAQGVSQTFDHGLSAQDGPGARGVVSVAVPGLTRRCRAEPNPGGVRHGLQPSGRRRRVRGIAIDPRDVVGEPEKSRMLSAQPENLEGEMRRGGRVVVERRPRLFALARVGLSSQPSPDNGCARTPGCVVGECLGLVLQRIVHRVQSATLCHREAGTGVLEIATNLTPCGPFGWLSLEGAEQGGVGQRLSKSPSHRAAGVSNGAGECRAASD